jgi:hypothetical protein
LVSRCAEMGVGRSLRAMGETNAEDAEEKRKGRRGEQATAKAEAGSLRE